MNLLFAVPNVTVPNAAALSALTNLADLADGAEVFVSTYRCPFYLMTSAAGLIPSEILASTNPARRWFRKPTAHLSWAINGTYNVDAVTGDDENDGVALPLKTINEYFRRVPTIFIPQQVNVLTSLPDSDDLVYLPQVLWHQSLSATYPTLNITGTRTLGANNVVISSSNEVGNVPPRIDIGIALTIGSIIQATSGPVSGSTAVVVSLVAGTNYNTSPWMGGLGVRTAPPSVGNNVAVTSRPTVNRVRLEAQPMLTATITDLDIKLIASAPSMTFATCTFLTGISFAGSARGHQFAFFGCGFSGNFSLSFNNGSAVLFNQSGLARTADANFSIGCGCRADFTDCLLANFHPQYGAGNGGIRPGAIGFISSLGLLYSGLNPAFQTLAGALVQIEGTLYGPDPGGASVGTDVRNNGHLYIKSGVTPTLTGSVELRVDGLATAIPALQAGLVVPAASPLGTWANWAAPPFSRNVLNYTTGSSITDLL